MPSRPPRARTPRHLWTGDWLADSERAREALSETAAPPNAPAPEAGPPAGEPPAEPRRTRRRLSPRLALAALLVGTVGAAFGAGALLDRDDGTSPLPAVSGDPLKPRSGQTRANAVYRATSPAVVSVRAGDGTGTGFLIGTDGKVVTNAHVVGGNETVTLRFGDGKPLRADVLGVDTSSDLAVLSVEPQQLPDRVKPLSFADSRAVRVGDAAIAIGNPFGLDRTATEGIVSGIGRQIEAPDGFSIDEVIQTDAPINPGNSGGPLLDESGQVIGVNSQIATGGSQGNVGIGFAVPSNTVRQVVPRLAAGERIERAYLGLASAPAPSGRGAEVESVVAGGPADRAGLEAGDVIERLDGREVDNPSDVSSAIADDKPGDRVAFEVRRGGSRVSLDATLGTRPAGTP